MVQHWELSSLSWYVSPAQCDDLLCQMFRFLCQVLTCWASIPFTYIFSFVFSNSLAAFSILMLIFFFFALVSQSP